MFLLLFPLLILAHLIGDFVLQTNRMVKLKHDDGAWKRALTVHSSVHGILTCLVAVPYCCIERNGIAVLICIVIPTSHWIIDMLKLRVEKAFNNKGGPSNWIDKLMTGDVDVTTGYPLSRTTKLFLFMLDQALHIIIIVAMVMLIEHRSFVITSHRLSHLLEGSPVILTPVERILATLIVGICSTFVSGIIVQIVTEPIPSKEMYILDEKVIVMQTTAVGHGEETERKTEISFAHEPTLQVQRGRLIGYLERILIVFIVCMGAYTAIAFIVAAKSLARLKKMDNQEWAEYFLVGTLCSLLCGTVWGFALKLLLNPVHHFGA